MGGRNYDQKNVVVGNAGFFVSNRQLLGTESPGSQTTKTRQPGNAGANTGSADAGSADADDQNRAD